MQAVLIEHLPSAEDEFRADAETRAILRHDRFVAQRPAGIEADAPEFALACADDARPEARIVAAAAIRLTMRLDDIERRADAVILPIHQGNSVHVPVNLAVKRQRRQAGRAVVRADERVRNRAKPLFAPIIGIRVRADAKRARFHCRVAVGRLHPKMIESRRKEKNRLAPRRLHDFRGRSRRRRRASNHAEQHGFEIGVILLRPFDSHERFPRFNAVAVVEGIDADFVAAIYPEIVELMADVAARGGQAQNLLIGGVRAGGVIVILHFAQGFNKLVGRLFVAVIAGAVLQNGDGFIEADDNGGLADEELIQNRRVMMFAAENLADAQEVFIGIISGADAVNRHFKDGRIKACVAHTFLRKWGDFERERRKRNNK